MCHLPRCNLLHSCCAVPRREAHVQGAGLGSWGSSPTSPSINFFYTKLEWSHFLFSLLQSINLKAYQIPRRVCVQETRTDQVGCDLGTRFAFFFVFLSLHLSITQRVQRPHPFSSCEELTFDWHPWLCCSWGISHFLLLSWGLHAWLRLILTHSGLSQQILLPGGTLSRWSCRIPDL